MASRPIARLVRNDGAWFARGDRVQLQLVLRVLDPT
jgi:hypothetical protein